MKVMNLSPLPYPIYDSHAHLADEAFDEMREEVIEHAEKSGIKGIVIPGDNLESSTAGVLLSEQYPGYLFAAVGVHPYDARFYDEKMEQSLKDLTRSKAVVAVGEIGLDYRTDVNDSSHREIQVDIFLKQLNMASQLQLPVIIHCRNAYEDLSDILDNYKKPIEGVVHCFSGMTSDVEPLVEMGMYIGFTGNITFKNAPEIREAASRVPLDRLLIETDSPYLTPHPYRGVRPNEPMYVRLVAETLSRVKKTSLEEICRRTTENCMELFGIHP